MDRDEGNVMFYIFFTNHEILKTLEKKPQTTKSSHQLLVNRTLIQLFIQFIILNTLLKKPKLYVQPFWNFEEVVPGWRYTTTWFAWFSPRNMRSYQIIPPTAGKLKQSHQLVILNIFASETEALSPANHPVLPEICEKPVLLLFFVFSLIF